MRMDAKTMRWLPNTTGTFTCVCLNIYRDYGGPCRGTPVWTCIKSWDFAGSCSSLVVMSKGSVDAVPTPLTVLAIAVVAWAAWRWN